MTRKVTVAKQRLRNTIAHLRLCIRMRDAGATHQLGLVGDPTWLINTAINRRAGWVEDEHSRSHGPRNHRGQLCRKYRGDWQRHLRLIADEVNTPRLVVRPARLGEHRWLQARLPGRFEC